ncbi:LarC family nickel insertion protein [Paenibacillus mesophilus]|uniref:nickel insertion protein n=1 Tax=Paenibacillus mesophilus TaxID=2582849 RepID=UPI00110ECDD3|nr:nickel insertion protein [Paenibacillus mesophilus]TMV46443.1 LarC family nickel insertion protein [Paenibacillus mesophilus]
MMFDHRNEHVDEHMVLLQANLDDMNPEFSSYVMDRLFEAGANDVYWIPIIMKRGRPGMMLNVLVSEERLERMEEIVFAETTTLGLRYLKADVHRLGRQFVRVATEWGPITVKLGFHRGELVQVAPEFKECEEAAKRHGVPLKLVYEQVRRNYAEGK